MPTPHRLLALLILCLPPSMLRAQSQPINLWPAAAPGEKGDIGPEHDTTKPDPKIAPDKYITRLGDVSQPTITIFRPAADKENGTAVVVCPGGGYVGLEARIPALAADGPIPSRRGHHLAWSLPGLSRPMRRGSDDAALQPPALAL